MSNSEQLLRRHEDVVSRIREILNELLPPDSDSDELYRLLYKLAETNFDLFLNQVSQEHMIADLIKRNQETSEYISPMDLGKNDPVGKNLDEPPVKGEPSYTASIFYYWWRFLRLNDEYKACVYSGGQGPLADLFSDFGDIYVTDFLTWWKGPETGPWQGGGKRLFTYKFETTAKLATVKGPASHLVHENEVAIVVPLNGNTPTLLTKIKQELRDEIELYKKANPKLAPKYAPLERYTIKALHNKVLIYEAVNSLPKGAGHLDAYRKIHKRLAIKPDSLSLEYKQRSFMSEGLRDAKALVENVKYGRFPDFK